MLNFEVVIARARESKSKLVCIFTSYKNEDINEETKTPKHAFRIVNRDGVILFKGAVLRIKMILLYSVKKKLL